MLSIDSPSFPISCLIISTFSMFSKASVTFLENTSLSTAKACPAGTAVSSAILIRREFKLLSSSFKSPQAFVCKLDLKELLQTISAKLLLECAGEKLLGFISYNLTFMPLLAIWYVASEPANPPPTTVIKSFILYPFITH